MSNHLDMKFGQIMGKNMGNIFRKTFVRLGWPGCRSRPFSIYQLTTINPLSANPEKWSNALKQIIGNLPTTCLSVFDHFMNLALKGLIMS